MPLGLSLLLLVLAGGLDLGPAPAGTLRVYLLRHGQAYSNLQPTPPGPPGSLDRLTPLGREQTPLRVEPRLHPMELGLSASGAPLTFEVRIACWKAGHDPAPIKGESLEAVGRRVLGLVRDLSRKHPGASVALVAHSEVVGSFVGLLRGTPPARRYPPGVRNDSITVVDVAAGAAPKLLLADHVPSEASVSPP